MILCSKPINPPLVVSPMPWPPTPGSYQSATKTLPSGATQTSLGRNQLSVLVTRFTLVEFVAGPLRLDVESADLARAGVGVQQLAAVLLRQQRRPRRTQMPVGEPKPVRSILWTMPGCSSCQWLSPRAARVVAVVAAGHDVADARLLVAVVVVVARRRCCRSCRRRARSCCGSCGRSVRGSLPSSVAAPDGAGPAVGACSTVHFAALAVAATCRSFTPSSPTVK